MSSFVLIVTNKSDITCDIIVAELRRRKIRFHRLNSEDIPDYLISFDLLSGLYVERNGVGFHLHEITAAYFRRPLAPEISKSVDVKYSSYCTAEWLAVMRHIYFSLEGRWFNSPLSISLAENKFRQLSVAVRCGFSIPQTVITNDFRRCSSFLEPNKNVVKPIKENLIEGSECDQVLFTMSAAAILPLEPEALKFAPVIFQSKIEKKYDVRATVVGDKVFAAAIESQAFEATSTDWRAGSSFELEYRILEMPSRIIKMCLKLTNQLELNFGAIDLIVDKEGNYWFLEINPNGQWGWIERKTAMNISGAIVDGLTKCSK